MTKVLIVDDEVAILEALCDVLEAEGYEVETAMNGAQGLEKARRFRPEVILLDLMMPVLDGRGTLEKLKADPQLSDISVLLMSAGTPPASLRESAFRFLPKPFELDALLSAVQQASGGAARGSQA